MAKCDIVILSNAYKPELKHFTRTAIIDVTGLLPNVDHACTIAGIPVDLTYDSTPVNAAGSIGTGLQTRHYSVLIRLGFAYQTMM